MTTKQKVPPAIHFQMTGQLDEIDYSWPHILKVCKEALIQEKQYVILPVMERQSTKRNRVRLLQEDKDSPKGLVLKMDEIALEQYYPYASARFDAEELATYAAKRFNELSSDDLDAMLANIPSQFQD